MEGEREVKARSKHWYYFFILFCFLYDRVVTFTFAKILGVTYYMEGNPIIRMLATKQMYAYWISYEIMMIFGLMKIIDLVYYAYEKSDKWYWKRFYIDLIYLFGGLFILGGSSWILSWFGII